MMRSHLGASLGLVLLAGTTADASTPVRRFALVAGANRGAAGRVPLRYAVTDAERFGDLVARMGGVAVPDRTVLKDPSRQEFIGALTALGQKTAAARSETERVEVVVYFSGHADEQGIMLGRETVPYRELRDSISAMGADIGIAILDACASGAITRLKGGKTHPGFLTDSSTAVKGYAFLTSSSETEAAQESDRLRGSFFTGALVTGLRGAADTSGDGRITLNEAYQFAFHETLAQTTTTEAGAQHPAYDIKMAGTGDVVMTDVRKVSSRLVLGEAYEGRFLVLSSRRALVADLYKPQGRAVELGLEPGNYDVYFEKEKKLSSAEVRLVDGQRTELLPTALKPATRRPGQRRGIDDIPTGGPDLLAGRTRLEFTSQHEVDFSVAHWISPRIAFSLQYGRLTDRYGTRVYGRDDFLWTDWRREFSASAGVRYYPTMSSRLRPFVGFEAGWFSNRSRTLETTLDESGALVLTGRRSSRGWEGPLLAPKLGVDLYVGRNFSIQFAGRAGSGPNVFTFGAGWTFGKGRPR